MERAWLIVAWTLALLATLGSLFFSEVMRYPPCVLCWYQRICMYPLIVVFGVGLLRQDRNVWLYATPLAAAGWLLALYQNLLYYGILSESLSPCTQGVSCTSKQIEWLGFITIPLMAVGGFSVLLAICGWGLRRRTTS